MYYTTIQYCSKSLESVILLCLVLRSLDESHLMLERSVIPLHCFTLLKRIENHSSSLHVSQCHLWTREKSASFAFFKMPWCLLQLVHYVQFELIHSMSFMQEMLGHILTHGLSGNTWHVSVRH